MHLLEKYSLNCGINPLKLDKAELFSSYYPIPFDKYIVFHASSGMPAKNYSYYQDVVDFIYESATKNGYGLIQIGGAGDKNLNKCLNLNGKTNLFQTSFVLKNASLLIANDSFSTHVCSSYEIPSISLYSVIQPEVAGPYWNNGKQLTIMAPLNGNKPSYSKEDPERVVDNIKPEQIIEKIKILLPDLLNKRFSIPETLAATAVAFVIGYIVIAWLLKFVATRSFMPFIVYRVILGSALLVLLATGVISA